MRLRVYDETEKTRQYTVKLGGSEERGMQGCQPRRKGDKESDRERRGRDFQRNRIKKRKRKGGGGGGGAAFMQQ